MSDRNILSRTVLLLRLLLGGSRLFATGQARKDRKPVAKVAMGIAYGLIAAYLIGIIAVMVYGITTVLQGLNLAWVLPGLLVSFYAMIVFIFGIYYAISVFYYSSENSVILALPFRPAEIVGAKFLQTLIYEYMIGGALFLPAFVTYGIVAGEGLAYYAMVLPLMLLVPVIPLAVICTGIMLLMRVVPFAKNKDRVATTMNIALLVVIMAISIASSRPMSEDQLVALLLGGDGSAGLASLTRVTVFFPGLSLAGDALMASATLMGWMQLLLFVGCALIAIAVVIWVGDRVYAQIILNFADGSSKRAALSAAKLRSESGVRSALKTLIVKEMRILFRTPAYLMNNVLAALIMPLLIIVMPMIYGLDEVENLSALAGDMTEVLKTWANPDEALLLPVLIGLAGWTAYALTFGNINMVSSTSISREGSNAYVMKYIPQSYFVQLLAKVIPGFILALVPNLIVILLLRLVLPIPISLLAIAVLIILISTILTTLVGLIFDVNSPKLKWENETQAVKNNMNSIFAMLAGFVLCIIPGGLAYLAWLLSWTPGLYIGLVLILLSLLTFFGAAFLKSFVPNRLKRLDL